jgi:hypothetical protein
MIVIIVVEYLNVQAREPSRAEPHHRAREVTEPSLARLGSFPALRAAPRSFASRTDRLALLVASPPGC